MGQADTVHSTGVLHPLIAEAERQAERTDYGSTVPEAARLLIDTFGHELLWVQPLKQWWLCSRTTRPGFWSSENREGAYARAFAVCEVLARKNPAIALTNPSKVDGVLKTVRPMLAALLTDFNADPYLLGVPNGVVDLRTGRFNSEVDPALKLTLTTSVPYDPDANCAAWLRHLRVLTRQDTPINSDGDPELTRFLQVLVGLSLIGRQDAHIVPFLYGAGRNGKGVFIDTVQRVLGDYADTLDQTVLFSRPDAHTTGLADLQYRRFVVADEVTGQQRINTALLKKLSGGGTIKARKMRQDNVTFKAEHTLWLVSNDRPNFGLDESTGLWDRILFIETGPTIPTNERKADAWLREMLLAEGPGILRWAVAGAVEFINAGLPERPLRVQLANDGLRHESSLIGRFMDEHCTEGGSVLLKDLRVRFVMWAQADGEIGPNETFSSGRVADLLRKRGVTVEKGAKNKTFVRGWSMRAQEWSDLQVG